MIFIQSYVHMVEKILNNTTPYGWNRGSHKGYLFSPTLRPLQSDRKRTGGKIRTMGQYNGYLDRTRDFLSVQL